MELAAGAMQPLLGKLGELLLDEYNLSKKVKKGVTSLATELMMMHAALRKVGDVPRDQLDDQTHIWAGKVRELSYEMEDAVDAFMVRVDQESSAGDEIPTIKKKVKKFLKKSTRLFRKGKDLHQISDAIEEAQDLAKQLGELRQRYGLEMHDHSATVAIDPRLVAMYKDATELVGVDGTRDELVEMLIGGDEWKQQELKVVSIVGFGRLGKTTLAKSVYEKIKVQFDRGAFVSVSQSPDVKRVFKDMLYELDKNKYGEIHNTGRGEKQLLEELAEFLENKRYLIVIDDIWDEQVWRFIKCAFSRNSLGSRLITTTRKVNVAEACSSSSTEDLIYRMKPLSDDDSQRLFYSRTFKSQTGCPHELEQVSKGILKKCGGVPLAIITIASLLASNQKIKTKEQWYTLLSSIGRGLSEGDSLEEMQKILSFSYYDLPSHLKTCLLYLGVFPEDYEIRRDRLIWRWIAEGFVQPNKQGTSLFELGEGYFNELVNRSMVQPVDIDVQGRARACRLHDMVLDLIRSLSNEENFVTILDGIQHSTPNFQSKIRRLSLQNCIQDTSIPQLATTSMSQVRSVTLFQSAINVMPSLSSFGVLRVLDLEGCEMSKSWYKSNLKFIRNLLHLRYLRLDSFSIEEFPVEIGKLQYLQMLDVSGCSIYELPPSVVLLRHLLGLRIGNYTKIPIGLGNLVSLEELTYLRVDSIQNNAKELGHLTELRVLKIMWEEFDGSLEKNMAESLGNLSKLQTLFIINRATGTGRIMLDGWVPSPQLRTFDSSVVFSTLPRWINSSSLPLLSSLDIELGELKQGDFQAIGSLPALSYLRIMAWGGLFLISAPEESFVVSCDAFPCLKECKFGFEIPLSVFPRGAMPMVQDLYIPIRASDIVNAELDWDIGNLPTLERVEVLLSCGGTSLEEVQEAETALRLAADAHPNHPTLLILKTGGPDISDYYS